MAKRKETTVAEPAAEAESTLSETTPAAEAEPTLSETTPAAEAESTSPGYVRDGRGAAPGDQVQYVVIETPGDAPITWQGEVTAVYEDGLVDLLVRSNGGYTGTAQRVPYGRSFGHWLWQDEDIQEDGED